jgi:hypothetical protein
MTEAQFAALLKTAETKKASDGWHVVPDGRHLTLHVARGGAGMSVPRVERLRLVDDTVYARTTREEVYLVSLDDIFAAAAESPKKGTRKAGFVSGG